MKTNPLKSLILVSFIALWILAGCGSSSHTSAGDPAQGNPVEDLSSGPIPSVPSIIASRHTSTMFSMNRTYPSSIDILDIYDPEEVCAFEVVDPQGGMTASSLRLKEHLYFVDLTKGEHLPPLACGGQLVIPTILAADDLSSPYAVRAAISQSSDTTTILLSSPPDHAPLDTFLVPLILETGDTFVAFLFMTSTSQMRVNLSEPTTADKLSIGVTLPNPDGSFIQFPVVTLTTTHAEISGATF